MSFHDWGRITANTEQLWFRCYDSGRRAVDSDAWEAVIEFHTVAEELMACAVCWSQSTNKQEKGESLRSRWNNHLIYVIWNTIKLYLMIFHRHSWTVSRESQACLKPQAILAKLIFREDQPSAVIFRRIHHHDHGFSNWRRNACKHHRS